MTAMRTQIHTQLKYSKVRRGPKLEGWAVHLSTLEIRVEQKGNPVY